MGWSLTSFQSCWKMQESLRKTDNSRLILLIAWLHSEDHHFHYGYCVDTLALWFSIGGNFLRAPILFWKAFTNSAGWTFCLALTVCFHQTVNRHNLWALIMLLPQGSATIDRYGRRKALLLSTSIMVVILATVTGLLSSFGSSARANAGITMIYLFMVVFSFGWTPMWALLVVSWSMVTIYDFLLIFPNRQALYPAEVLSYQARAKGLAFLGIVSQVATLINTFGYVKIAQIVILII